MFSINAIELLNWDYWQRVKIPLDEQIVVIVGPNGSGKTTLLDAIRTLLGISTSSKRNFKKYVKQSNAPHSWIVATVDNKRREAGRPFGFQITDDQVTLACKIERKGGEWKREYFMAAGAVTLEDLISNPSASLGLKEYQSELRRAGLSKAVLKVLSLEQGETDKLCEYTPKELLSLVFEVFGIQETLDNYKSSRERHKENEDELKEFQLRFARLEAQLSDYKNKAENYRRYLSLVQNIAYLESEVKSIASFVSLQDIIEGILRNIKGVENDVDKLSKEIGPAEIEIKRISDREKTVAEEMEVLKTKEQENNNARTEKYVRKGMLEKAIQDIESLGAQVEGLSKENMDSLLEEQNDLIKAKIRLEDETVDLRSKISSLELTIKDLEKGVLKPDQYIAEFSSALSDSGIKHRLLYDGIDILDEKWRIAIESILKGYRYVVVLEDDKDRWKAWKLGEKLGYRHFIVPTPGDIGVAAPKGTALSVIKPQKFIPGWIRKQLADIHLVDEVDDGKKLPEGTIFVTSRGYMKEKRGGRFIGVSHGDFVFGEAGRRLQIESLRQQLSDLHKVFSQTDSKLKEVVAKEIPLKQRIELQRKLEEYLSLKPKEKDYKEEFEIIGKQISLLENERTDIKNKLEELDEKRIELRDTLSRKSSELEQLQNSFQEKTKDFKTYKAEHDKYVGELKTLDEKMTDEWKTPDKISDYKKRYGDIKVVELEIQKVKQNLETNEWEKDPIVLELKSKLEADYEKERDNLKKRETEVTETKKRVDEAISVYIRTLLSSIRDYEKNLKHLAVLAGVDLEIIKPHLENEEDLQAAGLDIQWSFGGKKFRRTEEGDFSGGEEVIISLILLVALVMSESTKTNAGFIFIDEPFAHLDVFNIDKVAEFLQVTKTQFIITSPNTHNVNIYSAAGLCINTIKKVPGEKYAPIPSHIRRDAA